MMQTSHNSSIYAHVVNFEHVTLSLFHAVELDCEPVTLSLLNLSLCKSRQGQEERNQDQTPRGGMGQ